MLIEQRADLFYSPKESPTFDKLFAQATAIKAKIAPNADMKADDAATYDPEYNVILLNASDFENKHVRSRTLLRQSTAHELVHAVQNKSILEKAPDPKDRAKLLDEAILRWKTEEAFVKHHLEKEIQAETIAQRCDAEALDYFDRARGRAGFDKTAIESVVEARVNEFVEQSAPAYEKRARQLWKRASSR